MLRNKHQDTCSVAISAQAAVEVPSEQKRLSAYQSLHSPSVRAMTARVLTLMLATVGAVAASPSASACVGSVEEADSTCALQLHEAKKSDPYARPESRAGSACQLTKCEAGDDPTKYTSCEASLQFMWDQLQNVPWLMRPSVTCAEGHSMMVKDLCPSCKACTEADMCS